MPRDLNTLTCSSKTSTLNTLSNAPRKNLKFLSSGFKKRLASSPTAKARPSLACISSVPISPWLPVCAGLLALALALGKRRAELAALGSRSRPALEGYTLALLDQLLAVAAGATIAAYVAYALTARDSRALAITIPFVVYGVFRYVLLVHRRGAGEEPENVLLRDVPMLVTVAAWVASCAVVLTVLPESGR